MADKQTTELTRNTDSTPRPAPSAESSEMPLNLPGRKYLRWVWVAVATVIILAVGGVLLLQNRSQTQSARRKVASAPPPILIGTSAAQKGDIGIYINGLGVVTPISTVMVNSRVDGQLMSVNYVEGQTVRAGDSLVEIDPRPYQAQLTQAEGQLARDQALLDDARLDLERYQNAYSKNAIPKQQLDTQVATVFAFVGRRKRLRIGNEWFRVDLVFFHRRLRCLLIIDLKIGGLVHADIGQMHLYCISLANTGCNPARIRQLA
jgi:multidrug efflux system membrane fusion protein